MGKDGKASEQENLVVVQDEVKEVSQTVRKEYREWVKQLKASP
jgi:hypothetical protein